MTLVNWKRILKWMSLGGAVIGSTVFVLQKPRKADLLDDPIKIPEDLDSLIITSEPEEMRIRNESFVSHFEYLCRPTNFKVYSVYRSEGRTGLPIYHVIPKWYLSQIKTNEKASNSFEQENFYATVWIQLGKKKNQKWLADHLQKGNSIEFRLCSVGGGIGGVETGEKILTPTGVASYKFTFNAKE